ncbi:hypothetical protein HDN1F_02470 [gamma proteobacterium HdN1]|nr:hypothetical protein HDN1F_02470 [gamma proteobacterium HdN1]
MPATTGQLFEAYDFSRPMSSSTPSNWLIQLLNARYSRQATRSFSVLTCLGLGLMLLLWLAPRLPPLSPTFALLLHTMLESISILVSMLVFAICLHTSKHGLAGYLALLAYTFAAVGLIDFSHMLTYKGMPQFLDHATPEMSINLSIVGRLVISSTLLIIAIKPTIAIRTQTQRNQLLTAAILIVVLVHGVILFKADWLPTLFTSNAGQTLFKLLFEYGITAINAITALVLLRRMANKHDPASRESGLNITALFTVTILLILSQLCFSRYSNFNDYLLILGHIYKALAYFVIYRTIFVSTVELPFDHLHASQEQLKATLSALPDLLFEVDQDGRYVDFHTSQDDLLFVSPKDFLGHTYDEVMPPAISAIIRKALQEASVQGISRGHQYAIDLPMGTRWFEASVSLKSTDSSGNQRFIMLTRDISERIEANMRVRQLSHAVEQSPLPIIITDINGHIEYANPAFSTVSGYSTDEVIGKNPRELQSKRTQESVYVELWQTLLKGQTWKGEFVNRRKNGEHYVARAIISPVRRPDGSVSHYVGITEDVTEKKRTEAHIHKLAHYDPLTGLANRVLLVDHFDSALALAQRHSLPLALMFMDLDRFKIINDTLGHSVGDEVLIHVAKQFKTSIRDEDTVARRGGDEFVFIFPGINSQQARNVAQKLSRSISEPFRSEHQELNITSSIGIAMYPDDGGDFETLARKADVAMYRAKQNGRNQFAFYTQEMQIHSLRILQLGNGLRHAIERNQLYLVYQPQICLERSEICGVEALVRWRHPEWGEISPGEFIPVAEETGAISQIGEWVLQTALQQAAEWVKRGLPAIKVAINLSALQFRNSNLPDRIQASLEEYQVPASQVELELTEGTAMEDPLGAIEMLKNLHALGIQIAIDDFGTGYSSLNYLKKFQVSKLKIDQSFVRDISVDQEDRAIVTTIIHMAESLGFRTIAEGVETHEQLTFLREHGCDEVQGYYFSKPLLPAQFEFFLEQWTRRHTEPHPDD